MDELALRDKVVVVTAPTDVRRERGLGTIPTEDTATVDDALAIEAKVNIARVLEVPVRSVERLRALTGL